MRATAVVAVAAPAIAFACGKSGEEPDGGVDASLPDSAKDAAKDTQGGADAPVDVALDSTDAGTEAQADSCAPAVTIAGSCAFDGGGFCLDYTGSWDPDAAASTCPEGGSFDWDAACPTQGRVGSCYLDFGGSGLAERCYPPINMNLCLGFCQLFDGGFCPN